jgi:hypothetical protein
MLIIDEVVDKEEGGPDDGNEYMKLTKKLAARGLTARFARKLR